MKAAWLLLLPALAGCLSGEAGDRWRYERVLWEHEPAVASASDIRRRSDDLASRAELTLHDCWTLAVARLESLALQGEELVRLQTLFEEAVGTALPRVSFRSSFTHQERDPAVDRRIGLHRATVRQPIFTGLREYYAIRQGAALYAAKEHELRHARLALYIDVADAFYAVLELERDLTTTQDTLRLARERLDELTQRNKVGITRRSEVLAQEAEVASTQAAVERLRGALAVAGEVLRFVTGAVSASKLVDPIPDPGELPPLQTYLDRAVSTRSDLRALNEQIRAAEHESGIARSGWFPVVALEGNYYTHREGLSEDVNWDVILTAEIPIFEGFTTQARVREAASLVRSSRLRLDERLRVIALDVNRAHVGVRTFQAELSSLEKALASAQENYDLVQGEYRQGIVTNVEVLTSFNTLQQARLTRDRSRFALRLASVRLDVLSGSVPGGGR
jgi:outer membrane protein